MEYLSMLAVAVIVILFVQLVRIFLSDCDLSLQWAVRFGKSTAVLGRKVVWITGASSGIGEHLAYELSSVGCRLVLSARREEELQRVKKQCLVSGKLCDDDILVLPLDLVNFATHPAAAQTVISKYGKIDILINNAGRTQLGMFDNTPIEIDRHIMEMNFMGTVSITKAALPHMVESGGGHVVVVTSLAGKMAFAGGASYTASKHALQGMFEAVRIEQYKHNIAVTILCPGVVETDILKVASTETPGQNLNLEIDDLWKGMGMSAAYFSQLAAIAIANRMDEVWIAKSQQLFFTYVMQYLPSFGKSMLLKASQDLIRIYQEKLGSIPK